MLRNGPAAAKWLALIALSACATVLSIHLLNRVHQRYVVFGGPQQRLRLMSWNIGRIYLPGDSRANDRDLQHVAQVVHELNPHILAVQEVRDRAQLGRLVSALGRSWRGMLPEDRYDRRAALLLRLDGEFFQLPTSSGRIAQAARVRLPGGRSIVVASVHLDAFNPPRRLQQAEEILAGALSQGDAEVFLAGDFNLDPAIASENSLDHRVYGLLTRSLSDAAAGQGGTTLDARRLDYVLYRSDHVRCKRAWVLRDRLIGRMDHHPLIADFAAP